MEPDKKSSSKQKKQTQRTMAAFGFTKTVIHHKEVKIAIPEFAPDPETVTCTFCNKKFKSVLKDMLYM